VLHVVPWLVHISEAILWARLLQWGYIRRPVCSLILAHATVNGRPKFSSWTTLVKFEAFKTTTMNINIFLDMTSCSRIVKDGCFRQICPSIFNAKEWLIWPEYEGRKFLLSESFHAPKWTVSHLWRQWRSTRPFPFSMNLWPIINILVLYWIVVYSDFSLIFIN
jgi:hypothetical protein